VSIPLAPKREVPGSTSGRFLTIGSSLPLAEVTAAGSLVATGPVTGTPEPQPPAKVFLLGISLGENPSSFLGPSDRLF
jgi:hypothetical protein